jgi:hypothetical protein
MSAAVALANLRIAEVAFARLSSVVDAEEEPYKSKYEARKLLVSGNCLSHAPVAGAVCPVDLLVACDRRRKSLRRCASWTMTGLDLATEAATTTVCRATPVTAQG